MRDKNHEACKIIHTNLLPRMQFMRASFAAMAENERDDEKDGTSLYDGAAIALDDMIETVSQVMKLLDE